MEKFIIDYNDKKDSDGTFVYRIHIIDPELIKKLSRNFGYEKKTKKDGTKYIVGGYIEKEENLSHEGSCYVLDKAVVKGDSRVTGDALISGKALVNDSRVSNRAFIDGYAFVRKSTIEGDAHISGTSVIGNSTIRGHVYVNDAMVYHSECNDNVEIDGEQYITHSKFYGNSNVYGDDNVIKDCIVSECVKINGDCRIIKSTLNGVYSIPYGVNLHGIEIDGNFRKRVFHLANVQNLASITFWKHSDVLSAYVLYDMENNFVVLHGIEEIKNLVKNYVDENTLNGIYLIIDSVNSILES